jgi:hypothetical protein
MVCSRVKVSLVTAQRAFRLCAALLGWTNALGQMSLPQAVPPADSGGVNAESQIITKELKSLNDPTVMQRRVWLETQWDEYKGGIHGVEETLGGLWAWRVSTNVEWGVRLKVPYEWHIAGDAPGDSDKQGLGDLKVATGTAFRLSQSWRTAVGLELRLPTAADNLGGRDWRLQEFGSVAWDVTRWLTLSPSFEYNQSLAELDNGRPQHYLELFFPATFILPHHWSVTARYEAKADFERDNYLIQSAKVQIAKQLTDPPLGFAFALKKPFDGGLKEFQVNLIITYYFR